MSNQIESHFEDQNLKSIIIENKLDLYFAFRNIDAASPGSFDSSLNTISFEITQLLVNSTRLMELGYFDASFYSLRQAHELSWVYFLFADLDSEELINNLWEKWKGQEYFPDVKRIRAKLKEKGEVYGDFIQNMSELFEEEELTIKKLNKFVHKQGFHRFYVSVNHLFSDGSRLQKIKEDYLNILQSVVTYIAINRLSCDPFPILFADAEILSRLDNQPMSIPYTDEFIDKYIGDELLSKYKRTEVYKSYYSYYIKMKKKPEPIVNIIQYNIIRVENEREIIEVNLELLKGNCLYATVVVLSIPSAFRITIDSLSTFHTDRKNDDEMYNYTSEFVLKFPTCINEQWKGWIISSFNINDCKIYIEHDLPISEDKISEIIHMIKNVSDSVLYGL